MRIRTYLLASAAAFASVAGSANAATIVLVDQGGVTGSAAELGFKIAADYWSKMFTNNVTIRLGVGFSALGTGIIGSTGSSSMDYSIRTWENRINATKSNSLLDQSIVLPTLNAQGGFTYITYGADSDGNNTTTKVVNTGTTVAAKTLYTNTSTVKAVGGTALYSASNTQLLDGNVTFSSAFNFDFDPTNGLTPGMMDFIGVAIHEIGHALGFVSGVDAFDYYIGNGPGAGALGYDLNSTSIFSALDMFRYSNDPTNLIAGTGPVHDLTVGGSTYFSVNGGATNLALFATGSYNGDGDQASHWKDATGCTGQIGIMDPTFCYAQMGEVTALDLAAFDAIGWNLAIDALANPTYKATTAQIYAAYFAASAVPEPKSWAMMLGGFGLLGGALRRRARTTMSYAAR